MKISWQKIGLIVVGLVLMIGLFGKSDSINSILTVKSVSAATTTNTSVEVTSVSEGVTLSSNITPGKRALTLDPRYYRITEIKNGPFAGTKVFERNMVTGEGWVLAEVNDKAVSGNPIKYQGKFITIDKDGDLALKDSSGLSKVNDVAGEVVGAAEDYVADKAFKLAMTIFSWILANIQLLFAYILQWLMYFMDLLLNAGNILNNKGVHSGWTAVRDLCNMFFILILLAIAFMTIFMGTEGSSYSIKRALPMLVIAVLTINFSFLMCRIVVEGTDIISRNFVAEGEAGKLGDIMGVTELGSIKVPSTEAGGQTLENLLTGKSAAGGSDTSK